MATKGQQQQNVDDQELQAAEAAAAAEQQQQEGADANAPAPEAAPAQQQEPPKQQQEWTDPADRELEEAEAAARAEEEGAPQEAGEEGQQEGAAAEPPPAAETPAAEEAATGQQAAEPQGQQPSQQQPQARHVPYERFREVYQTAREREQEIAYLRGVMEARGLTPGAQGQQPQPQQPAQGNQQQPAAPQQPPQQDQRQLVQAVRQKVLDAAKQYDEGKITLADYKQIELTAQDAETRIKEQAYQRWVQQQLAAAKPQQPAQQQPQGIEAFSLADQRLLDEQARTLEAEHPYLQHLPDDRMETLVDFAYREAAASGRPYGSGAAESYRLREHVAQLSDAFGPRWLPNVQVQQQSPQQPAVQQQQTQKPALSPQAQARVQKMAAASQHPPNVNGMGQGGHSTPLPAPGQVESMTDEEIAALPAETQNRILAGG